MTEIQKSLEEITSEKTDLDLTLKSAQSQIETLKSASEGNELELTKKLSQKSAELEATNQTLADSRLENNKLSKEIELFKSEVEQTKETLGATTKSVNEANTEREKLSEEVSKLKSEISSLNENVESKTKMADEKHTALESLPRAQTFFYLISKSVVTDLCQLNS